MGRNIERLLKKIIYNKQSFDVVITLYFNLWSLFHKYRTSYEI